LYIHGGRDLKEGPISSLWRLNLTVCRTMGEDTDSVMWECISTTGKGPGSISHHSSYMVDDSNVIIYGGVSCDENANVVFKLNLDRNIWTRIAFKKSDTILPRDDHAIAIREDGGFMVFGGFVQGSRCNETLSFECEGVNADLDGDHVKCDENAVKPLIRASMSAACCNNKLWVFGGQDDDNNKLCDLWCYDMAKCAWSQIKCNQGDYWPCPRSGHSAVTWNSKMYIFGGIYELTKELNDLVCYDFASMKFSGNDDQGAVCSGQIPGEI
jgi:tRNA wybutosine-synthesizing protein 3